MPDQSSRMLVSRREAAAMLGISIDSLARLIQRGDIRHVRIGRSVLVPQVELHTLIERLAGSAAADIPGPGRNDEPTVGTGSRR